MAAPFRGAGPNDGWNDPPMFNYNAVASSQGQSPHRSHLNKRVAFPLSPATTSSGALGNTADAAGVLLSPKDGAPRLPPIQILPPTSSTSVHPPVPLLVPSTSPPVDASALPPSFASAAKEPFRSETLTEILERLELDSADSLRKYTKRILHETVDKLKENIQGRSREDVQQRLGVLDDQWREDKISQGAKVKLGSLASAIQNDDLKCADALHLSLMVDHISEVSQWMVGVKRLINELKLLQPPPSMTTATTKPGEENLRLFSPTADKGAVCDTDSPCPTASVPDAESKTPQCDCGKDQESGKQEEVDSNDTTEPSSLCTTEKESETS